VNCNGATSVSLSGAAGAAGGSLNAISDASSPEHRATAAVSASTVAAGVQRLPRVTRCAYISAYLPYAAHASNAAGGGNTCCGGQGVLGGTQAARVSADAIAAAASGNIFLATVIPAFIFCSGTGAHAACGAAACRHYAAALLLASAKLL